MSVDYRAAIRDLESRIPGRMAPDLDRIAALADLLGDVQRGYPSVHITGTNGKTSVARMVTTLFSAIGITAGTYTSPHLQTVRERLSVAGRPIDEEAFAALYSELAPLAELVDQRPGATDRVTYFEMLTAMAYWWFADVPVEVGVFEVGMGGTWDATNLVRGEVAVINTVDVDHPELGSTPAEVAREKAGIVKPGASVVSAAQTDEALAVIDQAVRRNDARLLLAGRDFAVVHRAVAVGGQSLNLRVGSRMVEHLVVPVYGSHQADNAAVALAAFAAFTGEAFERVDDDLLRQGFAAVATPGRLEVVHRDPTVLLDGAHNPHGARAMAAALHEAFDFRNLVLVVACLADKDLAGIVGAFRDVANHVVVTAAPSSRGASVEQMAAAAQATWAGTGVIVEGAATVAEALEKATGVAGEGDGVLVTGSLYTVGAARDIYLPLAASAGLAAEG